MMSKHHNIIFGKCSRSLTCRADEGEGFGLAFVAELHSIDRGENVSIHQILIPLDPMDDGTIMNHNVDLFF